MTRILINDARTKEVLKGKKKISEIPASIFDGYINVLNGTTVTAVVLFIDVVQGQPVVVAEAYPENATGGTMPEIEHFPFDEETTIKELMNRLSEWAGKP